MMNQQNFKDIYKALTVFFLILSFLLPITAEAKTQIIVSAAASLSQVLQVVGKAYESNQDNVSVTFNFAASGALLQQLAHGAPVDMFLSANQAFMDQAEAKGLIHSSSRRDFICNTLVLAVTGHAKNNIHQLNDLKTPKVERIAMGDPVSVPAGRYGRESLMDAGLWEAIQPKLIFGNSVRQVLDYLRRGEVDAGLLYATDAKMDREKVFVTVQLGTRDAIVYCAAITKQSKFENAANDFLEFILSPKGQHLFSQFGFQKIGDKAP